MRWGLELGVGVLQFAVAEQGCWRIVRFFAGWDCALVFGLKFAFLSADSFFHLLLLALLHFENDVKEIRHHLSLLVGLLETFV